MALMQTSDAAARHSYLQTNGLAQVIFTHDGDDFVCVQYHPKGIKGAESRLQISLSHLRALTLVSQVV
jgi:hypothetical protein